MTPLLPAFAGMPTVDRVYCMEALALLKAMPTGSVDMIATDPPYGIGYASSWTTRLDGKQRTTSGSFGSDIFNADWLPEAARVLKDNSALYLCSRWDVVHLWQQAIEAAGLTVVQRIIWDKCHWGMGDLRYYGSQTEDILFAVKGTPVMKWEKRAGNVWRIPHQAVTALIDGKFDHPTQKPTRLMSQMILDSSVIGDLVLDPFAGSGSTLVAAQKLGRRYIGCDLDAGYVDIARQRLALPYTLPLFAESEVPA